MIYVFNGTKTIPYPTLKDFKGSEYFKPDAIFREKGTTATLLSKPEDYVPTHWDAHQFDGNGNMFIQIKPNQRDPLFTAEYGDYPITHTISHYTYEKPTAYRVVVVKSAEKVQVVVNDYFEKGGELTFEPSFGPFLRSFKDRYLVKYNQNKKLIGNPGKEKAAIPAKRVDIDLDGVKVHLWSIDVSKGQDLPRGFRGSSFVNLTPYSKGEEGKFVKDNNFATAISERIAKEILDRKDDL